MDASRYTAFEDGYLWKVAEPVGPQKPGLMDTVKGWVNPASPGFTADDVRRMASGTGHASLKPEYFDMAAADINKDFLLGVLSDETKRKYFSGAAGLSLGSAVGGLFGGGKGAMIGGVLGALAAYLMDSFGIGLPKVYDMIFDARAQGKIKDIVAAADEKRKKDGKGPSPYAETIEDLKKLPTETAVQLALRQEAIDVNLTKARESNNDALERQLLSLKEDNTKLLKQEYVETQGNETVGAYIEAANKGDHTPTAKKAFSGDLRKLSEQRASLQLQIADARNRGVNPSELEEQAEELDAKMSQAKELAARGTPGYVDSYSVNRFKKKPLSFGQEAVGEIDFDKMLAGTTSLAEAQELAKDVMRTRSASRKARYPQGVGMLSVPSIHDPNESLFGGSYGGLNTDYTSKDLVDRARAAGTAWSAEPTSRVQAMIDSADKAPDFKSQTATGSAPVWAGPDKKKFVEGLMKSNKSPTDAVQAMVAGAKKSPGFKYQTMSGPAPASAGPNKKKFVEGLMRNNQLKEFAGSEAPMWWEVLVPNHQQKQASSVPMWWEVLQKNAGLPQDPNTMTAPPQGAQPQMGMSSVDPTAVFNHQAKVTEMKAQAALESAKADAEVKKKQAEMNLSGQQAGIDMQNKRFDQQNQQVEQAQQQATAQNPAVNASPQQPTATLNQPTAAQQPNAPMMGQQQAV